MANILVVDDSYENHRLIGIILKRISHTITSAYNGLEAIHCLSIAKVDLMITDINMPIMNGITLLEHLSGDEKYHDLPVIVITASAQEDLQRVAAARGASVFLTQPFGSWELKQAVLDCLGAPAWQIQNSPSITQPYL